MSQAGLRAAAVPVTHVEHVMGTVFSIRVPAPGVAREALDEAVAWLHRTDALFSTYREDSEIRRLDAGTLRTAQAGPAVRFVLDECARLETETDGYFSARPDRRALDPSGYVKGWAVQHVADVLTAAGSVNHYVNGGGDVSCAGRPEPGRGWRIGIADPFHRGQLLTSFESVGPVAVATSGLAERGAHIHDPHTGEPATGLASVTVVAEELVTADVCATAAAAMGPARAASWLADRGLQALLVSADGRLTRVGEDIDWDGLPGR